MSGVKRKRFLGIGGNVTLKLDSLELTNGDTVQLRAGLAAKGHSRTMLMVAAMAATGLVLPARHANFLAHTGP